MNVWPGAMIRKPPSRKAGAKPKRKPKGYIEGARLKRKIGLSFDPDQFGEIADYAQKNGQSFAAAVRDLAEWGMEAVND